jgi:Integrase core domain
VFPYLLGGVYFYQIKAYTLWATGNTCAPMRCGYAYLTAVIDVANRRMLAYKLCTTPETYDAIEIIEQAITRFSTPETVDTDQGSQLTVPEFVEAVTERQTNSPWTAKGLSEKTKFQGKPTCERKLSQAAEPTTSSSSASGAGCSMSASTRMPTTRCAWREPMWPSTSTGTTINVRTRPAQRR